MDRVFLDANVLFSAAYQIETPLRTLFTMPRTQLVTSAYALEEARRNLSSAQQQAELKRLCRAVEVVSVFPLQRELLILAKLPENDRPILCAAITFGRFYGQSINGVSIMPLAVYLKGTEGNRQGWSTFHNSTP